MLGRLLGLVAVMALVVWTATPSHAQEALDRPLRVGVIVPAVGTGPGAALAAAVARAANEGAIITDEELRFNAELIDIDFAVVTAAASGAAQVVAAAKKLVADEGAFAIVGGYSFAEASALSQWSKSSGVPFMNVGSSADALRNELCSTYTLHLEPSAAMYLDALVGWYVRSNFRQWYFVTEDSDEGRAQYERIRWSMANRHFGARDVGRTVLKVGASGGTALATAVRRANADVVVLLLSAADQVRILGELDSAGITAQVTGFPYPEAQTRVFFAAAASAAPRLGGGYRATAFETTIDAYGAREYNARFQVRWNDPNEPTAWAIYHAVRILYEAALFGGSTAAADVRAYALNPASVFDLHKGLGVSFRPWDQQLRQSLYLIKINSQATNPIDRGLLVGELPAIYLPGTGLIERLDQLGDLAPQSRCKL